MSALPPVNRSRFRLGVAAAAGVIMATVGGPITVAAAELPLAESPVEIEGQGQAWHEIQDDVDQLAQAMIDGDNLAGVSISASKDGKLVLSRAYGFANTEEGTPLDPDMQLFMGSTTKALIAGPAVWQAMEDNGIAAETALLYGADGLYGTTFDEDIAIGSAATGTPIEWYYQITVQHLMDHSAGFLGADTDAAMEMFGIDDPADMTYELVHKHFLRTRELRWQPGTNVKYQNHHIGSLKLVLEAITGTNAEDYAATELLGPMGLNPEIEIVSNTPGANMAATHETVNDEPIPYVGDYQDSVGFFAGGYRGSSRDVVELMTKLAEEYTPYEADRMGWADKNITPDMAWGDDETGYVARNGRVKGGTSYARMTVDGINVSVQTNKWAANSPIRNAAVEVVELLRSVDIPAHYDIWAGCTLPAQAPGFSQIARHGVRAADYQCLFDQQTGAGYRLAWIDASDLNGDAYFNALFTPDGGEPWRAYHGMTGSGYQARFDEMKESGFRPVRVDSYLSGGSVRYSAIFDKGDGGAYAAYHGLTGADHQDRFDELVPKGYRPTSLSVVAVNGQNRYTALYEKGIPGSFHVKSTLTPAQYQITFDQQRREGRRPVYLNGYTDADDSPRLVAIFSSEPNNSFRAKHGLASGAYQAEWDANNNDGYRTEVVTAYEGAKRLYYAAIWDKK